MAQNLTKNDLDFIVYSLRETRKKFESFDDSPNAGYQHDRIREVEKIISKIQALKAELS